MKLYGSVSFSHWIDLWVKIFTPRDLINDTDAMKKDSEKRNQVHSLRSCSSSRSNYIDSRQKILHRLFINIFQSLKQDQGARAAKENYNRFIKE